MKRGFVVGQVFVYILTLIVFVVILSFGYVAIRGVQEDADTVECIRFQNQLQTKVEGLTHQFGSVRIFPFAVPASTRQVCFADTTTPFTGTQPDNDEAGLCNDYPVICNAWKDNTTNVFLLPVSDQCDDFKIAGLELAGKGSVCIPTRSGAITLRMRGLGRSTVIEPQ